MVPAVKPAAHRTRSGIVGVLATPATIQGDLLHNVLREWAGDVRVLPQSCPGLAEQIESAALDAPETCALLERYLRPLLAAGADTIVLGCTHYPYLEPQIQRIVGADVALIDAGPAVAQQVARVLSERGLAHPDRDRAGAITYATTGDRAELSCLLARLDLPDGVVLAADPQRI